MSIIWVGVHIELERSTMNENSEDLIEWDRRKFVKSTGVAASTTGLVSAAQSVSAGSLNDGGYEIQATDSEIWTEKMQEYSGGTYYDTTTELAIGVGEFTWTAVDGSSYWHKVIELEGSASTWKEGNRYEDIDIMSLAITYPDTYTVNAEDRPKSRGAYEVPKQDTNWDEDDEDAVQTMMKELLSLMANNPAFDAAMFVASMGGALHELTDSTDTIRHHWDFDSLTGNLKHSAGAWFKATAEMLEGQCMDYTVEVDADRYTLNVAHGVQVSDSVCSPDYSPQEALQHSVSVSNYTGDSQFVTVSPKEFKQGVNLALPHEAKQPLKSGTPIIVELP